jgi:hypothetical protein
MPHLDRLEYIEPVPTCDIKVGTFYWTDPTGEKCDAEFYVRTCDSSDQDKQVSDYNEQYTDEYCRLITEGNSGVVFIPDTPNPIF